MSRPKVLDDNFVLSARIETKMYAMLKDIAALETINSGRLVTVQELVRNALDYVYGDNERLRESFRRSRQSVYKKFK